MTKKDFEAIADVLDDTRPAFKGNDMDRWEHMALVFASMLASTNPRFDRARFLKACGLEN